MSNQHTALPKCKHPRDRRIRVRAMEQRIDETGGPRHVPRSIPESEHEECEACGHVFDPPS